MAAALVAANAPVCDASSATTVKPAAAAIFFEVVNKSFSPNGNHDGYRKQR